LAGVAGPPLPLAALAAYAPSIQQNKLFVKLGPRLISYPINKIVLGHESINSLCEPCDIC
jgi:hypothetical protein